LYTGDPEYKGFIPNNKVDAYFCWPDQHSQIFSADLVIPNPEISAINLLPGDDFLILASDGLW
jgi:serine/threonine protein phosphatase PrpC